MTQQHTLLQETKPIVGTQVTSTATTSAASWKHKEKENIFSSNLCKQYGSWFNSVLTNVYLIFILYQACFLNDCNPPYLCFKRIWNQGVAGFISLDMI